MARQARTPAERDEKMRAIRAAALDVFSQKGFAGARLDDVASAAGVAKGTIYLYFKSKQDLLEAIVRASIGAFIENIEAMVLSSPASASDLLRGLGKAMAQVVGDPDRRRIAHLVMSEGARFPAIADFYHREVMTRGLRIMRAIAEKGRISGEFRSHELEDFPQLVIAPALVAAVWTIVFERLQPLDATAMINAHIEILLRALTGKQP
jgi:AcrR family transcriptional regulator